MRRFAHVLALLGLAAAPAAAAADAAELRALFQGSEVRRSVSLSGDLRYDVWALAPDGTLSGTYTQEYTLIRWSDPRTIEGYVRGVWSVEGKSLCLEGKGLEGYGRTCFRVEKAGPGEPKNLYLGTNLADGRVSELFVYPAEGG